MSRLLAFAAAVGLTASAATAAAAPQFVRVSFGDSDTAHNAAVTWNTDTLDEPSLVEFGATTAYGQEVEGVAFQANGEIGVVHEALLEGLEADTVYHYRVGGPGAWSEDRTFRTGPADDCAPVRFVALGDNRSDDGYGPSLHWNPILSEAVAHDPDFVVNTGDLVKDGDEAIQWHRFLEATGDLAASVPLMPSMGNHDDDKVQGDGASYNQLFTLPRNEVNGAEDYYFFTYGDAIVVALSTQTYTGGQTTFEEQAAWLDQVLTDNPKRWKFVFFHHPVHTGEIGIPGLLELSHAPNEKGQNAAFVPVFDEHGVDVVFSGHNHFYQRFEPMCCGEDGEGAPTGDSATGTTYIVTGGAGALTYDLSILGVDLCDGLFGLNSATGSVACDGRHHYVVVDVDGLDLHAKVFTTSSQLLGSSPDNVEMVDEFWIHKDGPAPACDDPEPDPEPDAGPETGPEPQPEPVPEPVEDAGPEPQPEPTPETVADAGPEPQPEPVPDTGGEPEPEPDAASQPETSTTPDVMVDAGTGSAPDTTTPGTDPEVEEAAGDADDGGCAGGGGALPWWAAALALAWVVSRRRARTA